MILNLLISFCYSSNKKAVTNYTNDLNLDDCGYTQIATFRLVYGRWQVRLRRQSNGHPVDETPFPPASSVWLNINIFNYKEELLGKS